MFFFFSSCLFPLHPSFASQVVAILQKFYTNNANALGLNFINELVVRFRHCSKWVGRQAFAFICQVGMFSLCVSTLYKCRHLQMYKCVQLIWSQSGAFQQCGQNWNLDSEIFCHSLSTYRIIKPKRQWQSWSGLSTSICLYRFEAVALVLVCASSWNNWSLYFLASQ